MRFRFGVIAVVVSLATMLGAQVAQAAPPSNDDFANATTVTEPLPYTATVDTTDATVEGTDPSCTGSQSFGPENTVWFAYTPSASGFVQANTLGSSYDPTLWVGTGTPGNFSVVGCNDDSGSIQARVIWDASAGTTYYIMGGTCCGNGSSGGSLVLNVETSAPPFTIDDLTVSPTGSVKQSTGEATISGTITCSNGPGTVEIDVSLVQRIGRLLVQGSQFKDFECSGTQSWSITIAGFNGLFVGGRAQVDVRAFGEDDAFLSTDATVRLGGHRGHHGH